MIRLTTFIWLCASGLTAEAIVAARTLPAQTIIGMNDLVMRDITIAGGETDPLLFVGMETRVAVYAGRPLRVADVGAPAIVERNQIIGLVFEHNGLVITTDGRALERAGPGDVIRIMNLASRNTIRARIDNTGRAIVTH